jgi:hypothetical protein
MPCRTDQTGTPIEAVSCGLRLGCPDGEVLYERVHDAISETCRVFMSHGVGAFETWKVGIPYPCMTGDIASTAGLTVHLTAWPNSPMETLRSDRTSLTACATD